MNYGWLDPFGQRYVGSRKGAAIWGCNSYEAIWVLEKLVGASRRGGEASRRGEALWPVGLHGEVRCCGLVEQMIFRRGDVELA